MDFCGKVGINMAVSGIGGAVPVATFRQMNVSANQTGRQATESNMQEATRDLNVSNFGNETKVGNGQTSQISEQIASDAVESISQIMEQDDEFEAPANGSGTAFSSSGFQQAYDTSFDPAMQRAASSYAYFNQ